MGGLWRASQEPKRIFLRGQSLREELKQRPAQPEIELLLPEAFRLEVSADLSWLVEFEPDLLWRMAWFERGLYLPHLRVLVADELPRKSLSFSVYGVLEEVVEGASCAVTSVLRFLFEATWRHLERILTRDRVEQMAQQQGVLLEARDLGRLAKYFRLCLRAGVALPEVDRWPLLAQEAPFDEIGQEPRTVRFRKPLRLEERQFELLMCMPKNWRVHFGSNPSPASGYPWRRLQALDEFFSLLARSGDSDRLLCDPRTHFQSLLEQHSSWLLARLRAYWESPSRSLPFLERWMLRVMRWPHLRESSETVLGSLLEVEADHCEWSTALLDLQVGVDPSGDEISFA